MTRALLDVGPTLDLLEKGYLDANGDRSVLASIYRGRAAALERPSDWDDDEETKERVA
jgi:hypothetical protein